MANRLLSRGQWGAPILAAMLLVSACGRNPGQHSQAGGPHAMPVKVLEARAVTVNDSSEYVATLKSRDSAVIMPQVEGQVTQIFVHSGNRVREGSALLEIDPLKQQATVKSLESSRAAQRAQLALHIRRQVFFRNWLAADRRQGLRIRRGTRPLGKAISRCKKEQ